MQCFVEKDNFSHEKPWLQSSFHKVVETIVVLLFLFFCYSFQMLLSNWWQIDCSRYLTQCSATCSSQQKSWPRECIPYQSLLLPSLCALILMLSLVLCLCLLFPDISHAIGTRRAIGAGNEVDTTVSQNGVSVIISMRRANVATSRSSSSTCIPQSGLAAFGNTWVLDCNITSIS